jgi:tetratricopeptide (TPR) repeat protein
MSEIDELLRAARDAEAATLWDVAAERYEAALTLIADTPAAVDEAALLTSLGSCYWNLSEARTAWRTLRRAIALYSERGDGAGVAWATLAILRIWGPPERQRAMADTALEALGDADEHLRAHLLLRAGRMDEAFDFADARGFDDVRIIKDELDAWATMREGRIDQAIAALQGAHERYAALNDYYPAAGVLRMAGFNALQAGRMDDGERLAAASVTYARRVHLRFHEQLALMDLVGAAFAHADFTRCEALIAERPAQTDFRADLYRMWIAELRGDIPGALALLVDPDRGGGATTALSQIHAAAAGTLFHAGREEAAGIELLAWAEIARQGSSFPDESPALIDCLIALGSDALVKEIRDAVAGREAQTAAPDAYSTLQGRGVDEVRGSLALRQGDAAAAEGHYRAGVAWAEREGCPLDAARCHEGLGSVSHRVRDIEAARSHLEVARSIFARHDAALYAERVARTLDALPE